MTQRLLISILLILPYYIYGQSFIGIRANALKITGSEYNSFTPKVGFGLHHEKSYSNGKNLKLIWAESLDYKRANIEYETTGWYAHSYTKVIGTLHLLDAQLEGKLRTDSRLFGEIGVFMAFSLMKKLAPSEISRYKKDFNSFNGGFLAGVGYQFNRATVLLNAQQGMFSILQNKYKGNKTQQLNLSVLVPVKSMKPKF